MALSSPTALENSLGGDENVRIVLYTRTVQTPEWHTRYVNKYLLIRHGELVS
jgi:hypothetical protein